LIEATEDPQFKRILLGADIVAPDGMPLVWLGKVRGRRTMERVYGPDLMKFVCGASVRLGLRHYFYGGAAGVAQELALRLANWYPGLIVAGTYSPPFRSLTTSELEAVAARIDASEADLLWVGLSTPKQERWIAAVRPLLRRVKVVLSVGAAFDFHTGRKSQAPLWMRSSGLEWLFRLSQEPRRLWRRYAYNNPRFVWLVTLETLGLRAFGEVHRTES
jgi:N-acetylglucosaminyldiphosphoundecaprenol N-acetyl-beta-D-mannosaminyltransferase